MKVFQAIPAPGLDQERRDCCNYEDRLQALACDDNEGRAEGAGRGQFGVAAQRGTLVDEPGKCAGLLFDDLHRSCGLDQISVGHHFPLYSDAQAVVDQVETGFRQLEALQVRADGSLMGRLAVSLPVQIEAFADFRARNGQR